MAVNSIKNPNIPAPATGGAAGANEASKSGQAAAVRPSAANAYAKVAQTTPRSEAANVQISPKARELSQVNQIINETPEIREDKVAHFKNLIAKGEYKPDASKIADGILREAIRDDLSKSPDIALE